MMFWEAVYLPECLNEFLNISQVLNVQKFLHRYFFRTILYLQPQVYNEHLPMPTQQQKENLFVIEKLGTAIWRRRGGGLNLHVFSVDGTNAIREVPWVSEVIHDLRPSCPGRGGITSCFKCFIIDMHTS